MSDYRIRAMRPEDVELAVEWAATEGWNPGLSDAACFAAPDPAGFLIGELDGSPAATVSCVNYDDRFAFLGFYKSQLISVVNVFGLFGGDLPIFRQNLSWYLLTIVTIVSTVLWGRVYCGRLCAFGAFTQLLDRVAPNRWQIKIPKVVEKRASLIKYGILAFAISYFVITRDPLIYPYIEPFWMFGLHGKTLPLWTALAVLLVVSLFVRNAYCRFLCPLGAALGLLSKLTVFRIKRWKECTHCRICEKACEWGAIRGPQIVLSECVRCDDCERLYDDTKKCPHHLIIIRKADIMARRSVPASAPAAP